LAIRLREQRIDRIAFSLKNFRGVNQDDVNSLAEVGIRNVNHMLKTGHSFEDRERISRQTWV